MNKNLCQILKKHFAIRYPVGQWFLNFMHVETPDCKKKKLRIFRIFDCCTLSMQNYLKNVSRFGFQIYMFNAILHVLRTTATEFSIGNVSYFTLFWTYG